MKTKNFKFGWLLVVLFMLFLTDCTPQPKTVTPEPVVQAAQVTPESVGQVVQVTQAPASTPTSDIQAQEQQVMQALLKKCTDVQPGYACLVEGPVQVEAKPERYLTDFEEPGQTIVLADLQRLKLGEAGSIAGVVVMRIQTEWPGGDFTVLAIGDVELINEVPYGANEFNPMQMLTLTSGENEEDQPLINGLFVASPDDGNLSTLVVNRVELTFGSGGWLSSHGGGLNIQTTWGSIGTWFQDRVIQVKRGFGLRLTHDEIVRELEKEPSRDYQYDTINKLLKKYFGENQPGNEPPVKKEPYDPAYRTVSEALKKYFGCKDWETNPGCGTRDDEAADKKIRALQELRKKQKRWKGGWWKMTYGPSTISGSCLTKMVAAGDGSSGYGEPYSVEIPICRGNNGQTLLYDHNGQRFDRLGPNLYVTGSMAERQNYGTDVYVTSVNYRSIQVLSLTRMKLNIVKAEAGGCTSSFSIYLDFLREDPAIRCGYIEDIAPDETPEPAPIVEPPQPPPPPVEGKYSVGLAFIKKDCNDQAKDALPDWLKAGSDGVSLKVQDSGLLLEAHAGSYLLARGPELDYFSERDSSLRPGVGAYALEQPLDENYTLALSLFELSTDQFGGSWQVASKDGEQYCAGSVDLRVKK